MSTDTELTITDPVWDPSTPKGIIGWIFGGMIKDERDLPFIRLALWLQLLLVPPAVMLFWPGLFQWWAVPAFVLPYFWYLGPFILMLHNTSHRPLFKRQYSFLNRYIPWLVGPLLGLSPETYFAHHMGMHHAEGNLPDDLSSTMRYQRDSFIDFLKYYGRFMVGYPGIVRYFIKAKRTKMLRRFVVGELTHFAVTGVALWFNWQAALVVLVFPLLFTRFMLMSGNWAQHAFVDPEDPTNDYRTVTTFINSTYNHRCFNDGYHLGHHIKASRHWLEMPEDFLANVDKIAAADGLVFEKIDYFLIFWMLMFGRYGSLAKHVVQLPGGKQRSEEELVALFKRRLARFESEALVPLRREALAGAA